MQNDFKIDLFFKTTMENEYSLNKVLGITYLTAGKISNWVFRLQGEKIQEK